VAQQSSVRDFSPVVSTVLYLTTVDCIGWDPIFEYKGQTYAEMDKAEKVKTVRVSLKYRPTS
jgi:hypothetical protein